MHKKQVEFHRDSTSWWLTCVHCGEQKPAEQYPIDDAALGRWLLWCSSHPCMLPPNPHYSDADRAWHRRLNGLEP